MVRPNILICASPKSGSSHIKLLLQKLLRYRSAYAATDNVLYTPAAQVVFEYDEQILHHHVEATPCNVAILNRYQDEVKVVLTFRNVLDSLVSMKDYLERPTVIPPSRMEPGADWARLDDEDKYKWVVYNATPWYFRFWVQWKSCDVPRHEVWYDEFFKDQVSGIRDILDWVGIDDFYGDDEIAIVSRHREGKFNVGRSGRGKELLPKKLIDVVYKNADSWGPYWGSRIRHELLERS